MCLVVYMHLYNRLFLFKWLGHIGCYLLSLFTLYTNVVSWRNRSHVNTNWHGLLRGVCTWVCREWESCLYDCDRLDTADKEAWGQSSQTAHRYRMAQCVLSICVCAFFLPVCCTQDCLFRGRCLTGHDAQELCVCVSVKEGNGWLYTPSNPAGQHKSSSVSPHAD